MGEAIDPWDRAAPAGLSWQSAADDPQSARRRRYGRLLVSVAGAGLLVHLVVGGPVAQPAERPVATADALAPPVDDVAAPAPAPAPTEAPAPAAPPPTAPAAPPTTQPAPPAPPVTPPPTPPTVPPARAAVAAVPRPPGGPVANAVTAYKGLGTWVDVYDWSVTYTKGQPTVGPDDVDRMAAAGV